MNIHQLNLTPILNEEKKIRVTWRDYSWRIIYIYSWIHVCCLKISSVFRMKTKMNRLLHWEKSCMSPEKKTKACHMIRRHKFLLHEDKTAEFQIKTTQPCVIYGVDNPCKIWIQNSRFCYSADVKLPYVLWRLDCHIMQYEEI